MFEQLDQLKARLDAARPLPAATMRSLHDDLLLRWTYHSNAIEGNTLTLLETKVVLEGITVGGKPLRDFLVWYNSPAAAQLHPVQRAARVHADFVGIHPFVDGNGRTSRLLMNLELMKSGFPPCVITVDQRLDYYTALDKLHTTGDYSDFTALVAGSVSAAFEPYWRVLG